MIILVTLVLFVVVFVVVTLRRRATTRWRPDPSRHVGERGVPWCTKAWVQKEPPRRSMRGASDRVTGQLCVDAVARVVTFRVADGQEVQFANVRSVNVGASGSDFVNTWVEVHCDVNGQTMAVYLNDARWLGWRPLVTSANTRLADALVSLIPG